MSHSIQSVDSVHPVPGGLLSMTGFGRGEASDGRVKVTVELGTVNRKQFDCSVSLPRECACLEAPFQKLLRARISRGYVKGSVSVAAAPGAEAAPALDMGLLAGQVAALRAAAKALGLPDTLTASDLARFPDILRGGALPEDPRELWPLIERAAAEALDRVAEMRAREGAALAEDLRARLAALRAIHAEIRALAPAVPAAYRAALEKRLAALLPPDAPADPAALARETALFADRCDISEELTRLESHFLQAEKMLSGAAGPGPQGRALDFLCQEFFREINTAGSKANDAEIAKRVIAFKTGLEAIREQVQNIE